MCLDSQCDGICVAIYLVNIFGLFKFNNNNNLSIKLFYFQCIQLWITLDHQFHIFQRKCYTFILQRNKCLNILWKRMKFGGKNVMLCFLSRANHKSIQIQNQKKILISINNAIQYDSVYHIYYIITVKIRRWFLFSVCPRFLFCSSRSSANFFRWIHLYHWVACDIANVCLF